MTRFFDIVFALLGLIVLSPVFIILGILIKLNSKGPIFYKQERIGRFNIPFHLLKLRSMYIDADKKGLLTIGGRDPRITSIGYVLRKYKFDELPQLFNVLRGHMSFVGPRPEVKKYVELYSNEQKKVLNVRPGITDNASVTFSNENEILSQYPDPEKAYIELIMPEKIKLNMEYILAPSVSNYFRIILKTIRAIFI